MTFLDSIDNILTTETELTKKRNQMKATKKMLPVMRMALRRAKQLFGANPNVEQIEAGGDHLHVYARGDERSLGLPETIADVPLQVLVVG